jgi:prepilin-type N-terminal cleavage/methylation domain-containing protein
MLTDERTYEGTTRRRGFTMAEIIIALAIMTIASVIVVPTLVSKIRSANTSALAQTLSAMNLSVFEYKKAVTVYPSALSVLSIAPTTSTVDLCGTTAIGSNANSWRGPYTTREVLSTGIRIGDAQIQNTPRRTTSGTPYLIIDVAAVEQKVADELEAQFDATTSSTTGTIRWTTAAINYTAGSLSSSIAAAPSGTVNLSYYIPISGC